MGDSMSGHRCEAWICGGGSDAASTRLLSMVRGGGRPSFSDLVEEGRMGYGRAGTWE